MDRHSAAARAHDSGWRRRWLTRARRLFVYLSLVLLLAAQVFGAIHLRGSPGLELLIAALTPGLIILCVLQWLAGPYRLKWCVALEQVGVGAVLSVLLAVGLELISALLFGGELRICSPSPSKRAPFAVAGTEGFTPWKSHKEQPGISLLRKEAHHGEPLSAAFFRRFLDLQLVSCGIGSRGVSRHIISYVAGHTQPSLEDPSADHIFKEEADSDRNTYICIGFIFAYMILCIGFAEEFSKVTSTLLMRASHIPPRRDWDLGSPESLSAFEERAEKEANSAYHYVTHPLSMVVAGCCAALGFATIENLSYVFATKSNMEMALTTAWVRAFTAIPSHAANTGIAACFLATVAAHAAAKTAATAWQYVNPAASLSAPEGGEEVFLEESGVRTVGEARVVEISTGSSTRGTPTSQIVLGTKSVNPFPFRVLLQSVFLPGMLHGCYDAALTLASTAYTTGTLEGGVVAASGWLVVALVAWWASIITFCTRWCSTKRLEGFYVYFSGRPLALASPADGSPPTRTNMVAPTPGQLYFADSQQHQLLQQQLLQQQFAPIPADIAAWHLQQQHLQQQQLQQQQLQISLPMHRQYAPILPPPQQLQHQQEKGS